MWNDLQTGAYEGMIAETVSIPDQKGNTLPVYWSRPLGTEQYPSIVLIPHMPGWDEWCRETARRFTQHGYGVMCPNIYHRAGEGTPSEVAKRSMEAGGQYDADVMDDTKSCLDFLKMQKGVQAGHMNRYAVTNLVCRMQNNGIYRNDIPMVMLHLTMEGTTKKNKYYTSSGNYDLSKTAKNLLKRLFSKV